MPRARVRDEEREGWWLRYRVSFWSNKNVLKLIIVVVAQIYEYTKSHWLVHLKWGIIWYANCILTKLFFKKGLVLCSLRSEMSAQVTIDDVLNSKGDKCLGEDLWICGFTIWIKICITLIYILSIFEARNSQNSLPQSGATLDNELLLPLVRPDRKTIGNGPRVYKNM